MDCDNPSAAGGPHRTRGVIVGPYLSHDALLVRCTHRSRRGHQCESVQLVLPDRQEGEEEE